MLSGHTPFTVVLKCIFKWSMKVCKQRSKSNYLYGNHVSIEFSAKDFFQGCQQYHIIFLSGSSRLSSSWQNKLFHMDSSHSGTLRLVIFLCIALVKDHQTESKRCLKCLLFSFPSSHPSSLQHTKTGEDTV